MSTQPNLTTTLWRQTDIASPICQSRRTYMPMKDLVAITNRQISSIDRAHCPRRVKIIRESCKARSAYLKTMSMRWANLFQKIITVPEILVFTSQYHRLRKICRSIRRKAITTLITNSMPLAMYFQISTPRLHS